MRCTVYGKLQVQYNGRCKQVKDRDGFALFTTAGGGAFKDLKNIAGGVLKDK